MVAGRSRNHPCSKHPGATALPPLPRRTPQLGDYFLHCEGQPHLLFTENETNNERLFGTANPTPYVKDGINDYVVAGRQRRGQPAQHRDQSRRALPIARRRRDNRNHPAAAEQYRTACRGPVRQRFEQIVEARRHEADEFYRAITPAGIGEDAANVMRQALAGMLWSKQYFFFDVDKWLRSTAPIRCGRRPARCATANGST